MKNKLKKVDRLLMSICSGVSIQVLLNSRLSEFNNLEPTNFKEVKRKKWLEYQIKILSNEINQNINSVENKFKEIKNES